MDVGVFTVPLGPLSRSDAFEYLADRGVETVELGCGGYPGDDHLSRTDTLDDADEQAGLVAELNEHDLSISALAIHNNPLHPHEQRAENADTELRETIRLASQLDVDTVTCFSGLPGGAPADSTPNWITAPWPPEHLEALEYQWEVAAEYWSEIGSYAEKYDVNIAIEMHPNTLVYEPSGLLRLREETNGYIGANFDPSHLYWQGIDPIAAIRQLGRRDALHHVHAKDTELYETNSRTKGVLDTTPYDAEVDRSWLFRTVGYGHGEQHWKRLVSALRLVEYDGALSIEHEDSLTSAREGLEKAVDLLQRCILETKPDERHWIDP